MFPRFRNRAHAGKALGFDSGLEATLAKQIEGELKQPVLYEQFKLRYSVPQSFHLYTPDFELANGIIIEGKGLFLAADRGKHLLVKAQYPELDIRFVFSSAKTKIAPGAKSTVSEWADKNGYKWAVKLIPPAWALEAGPKRKPRTVIADGPLGGWK